MKYFFIIFMVAAACSAAPRIRPISWAQPVISTELKNWHKVDDKLYRSEQPERNGMRELVNAGIKYVLNLREYHSDNDEAHGFPLVLHRVDINTARIKTSEVIEALKIIKEADGPVLVHCWHGSDRTGLICAMYRIIFQGWTKDEAIDELINGKYGYHSIYKNIPEFIRKADIAAIRKALKMN